MPFRFLRDPLFICVFTLYCVNRFLVKPNVDGGFFHTSFNDLICIPFLVPMMLGISRCCRLRGNEPPRTDEIFISLIVWATLYEIVFPRHPLLSRWTTADPMDVAWYACGACFAAIWWDWWYRPLSNVDRTQELPS